MTEKKVSKAVEPRTGDVIVYTKQTDAGRILWAHLEKFEVIPNEVTRLVPLVVNIETARARALKKLDGLDRLVLGL